MYYLVRHVEKKKEQSKETKIFKIQLYFSSKCSIMSVSGTWSCCLSWEQDRALCAVTALANLPQLGGEDEPRLVLYPVVPRAVQVLTKREEAHLARLSAARCGLQSSKSLL